MSPFPSANSLPPCLRRQVRRATGPALAALLGLGLAAGLGCASGGGGGGSDSDPYEVTTLVDADTPPSGTNTLRAALAQVPDGGTVTFDQSLNGKTLTLSLVGAAHSMLPGEFYNPDMTFGGYRDRDYGRSALYAKKNVTLDASNLPDGITLAWGGGGASHARVLAVYGNLTMRNIAIVSGYASAEALSSTSQPWTLARGGGLAVWGTATLDHCTLGGNTASGDLESGRDRGTYGGGIYANAVVMRDCVVSGNLATGYGAAGGGIYSVGGGDGATGIDASLTRCAVTGNRVTAQHAYGGGLFTLGGGPSHSVTMTLTNCTVARNRVEEKIILSGQHYSRGGGVYMGGGSLSLQSCTVAENQVTGSLELFNGKPNLGGGGVAATIGNAHVVESMKVRHSILVGNTLNGAAEDLYTGSLLHFYSEGYNRIGKLDFSQILVPVPPPDPGWLDLSRKHYPKVGDLDGLSLSAVLDAGAVRRHATLLSVGTDPGEKAVLWYPPLGQALAQVPPMAYTVKSVVAGYTLNSGTDGDFLDHVVAKLRTDAWLGGSFWPGFATQTAVSWHSASATWPSDPLNKPWIQFWRDLDVQIGSALGTVALGDAFWDSFSNGESFGNVTITKASESQSVARAADDQLGNARPGAANADVGAIEE